MSDPNAPERVFIVRRGTMLQAQLTPENGALVYVPADVAEQQRREAFEAGLHFGWVHFVRGAIDAFGPKEVDSLTDEQVGAAFAAYLTRQGER